MRNLKNSQTNRGGRFDHPWYYQEYTILFKSLETAANYSKIKTIVESFVIKMIYFLTAPKSVKEKKITHNDKSTTFRIN